MATKQWLQICANPNSRRSQYFPYLALVQIPSLIHPLWLKYWHSTKHSKTETVFQGVWPVDATNDSFIVLVAASSGPDIGGGCRFHVSCPLASLGFFCHVFGSLEPHGITWRRRMVSFMEGANWSMLEMSAMMVSRDPRPVNGSGMPLVLCFSFLNSSSQVPMLPLAPRWVNGKREGHGMSACLDFADRFRKLQSFLRRSYAHDIFYWPIDRGFLGPDWRFTYVDGAIYEGLWQQDGLYSFTWSLQVWACPSRMAPGQDTWPGRGSLRLWEPLRRKLGQWSHSRPWCGASDTW